MQNQNEAALHTFFADVMVLKSLCDAEARLSIDRRQATPLDCWCDPIVQASGSEGTLQRPWCSTSGSGACAQADPHPCGA